MDDAISKLVPLPFEKKACKLPRLTMRNLSSRNIELGASYLFLLRIHEQVDLLLDWLPRARGIFL